MASRVPTDASFIVKRLQEYRDKREKVIYVFWILTIRLIEYQERCGVGDEEKRFTRSSCKSGVEPLS